MTREEMIASIVNMFPSIDELALDSFTDDQLAAIVAAIEADMPMDDVTIEDDPNIDIEDPEMTPAIGMSDRYSRRPHARIDRDRAAVQMFAERSRAALAVAKLTPTQFVAKFLAARKKRPSLTASQYGVPSRFTR